MILRFVPLLALAPLVAACADPADGGATLGGSPVPTISIGAGSPGGLYERVGTAICAAVAAGPAAAPCAVVASDGSVENLQALQRGAAGFALTQADTALAAQLGVGPFREKGPDRSLRSVLALGIEPLAVVVRADAPIAEFAELRGKRIDPGAEGSGTELTMRGLMLSHGWTIGRDVRTVTVPPGAAADALCSGRVDAVAFVGAQPNPAVETAAALCPVRLLSVAGPVIRAVVVGYPTIDGETIPAGTYAWQTQPVRTVGLQTLLATTDREPDATVRAVVEGVRADIAALRRAHPSLARITPKSVLVENDILPLHAAAAASGIEAGTVTRDELLLAK
ncbi:TAXI family TRAP transporter solute-binding subunit [Stella sp.]|uniref:TAXI family TRAP transporter solute-binding subunit n=1 Tax=Stella sp. TaxID=2912054 RepID=UPI0035B0B0C9